VEDLLVDPLALPDGPNSNVARIVAPEPSAPSPAVSSDAAAPRPPTPPPPPEAEIVIAELLDGPPPSNVRAADASPWPPQPDDIVISDLLADRFAESGPSDDGDDTVDDTERTRTGSGSAQEPARIAADRARRRRNRRGGRRKPPGGG